MQTRNVPCSTHAGYTGEELRYELYFRNNGAHANKKAAATGKGYTGPDAGKREYVDYKDMILMY